MIAVEGGGKENGRKEESGANRSSPNPGDAPVISPLTEDDMINIAAASRRPRPDDVSLIVHADDTQSELDAELDAISAAKSERTTSGKEETKQELIKTKRIESESKKGSKEEGKDSKSNKDTKSSKEKKSSSDKSTEKRFVGCETKSNLNDIFFQFILARKFFYFLILLILFEEVQFSSRCVILILNH